MTINCRGRLVHLTTPAVMGILNLTPDSFYDGGKHHLADTALAHTETMLAQGALFIDVGGMSTRPGAPVVSANEELSRVMPVIEKLLSRFPDALFSIDTLHAETALQACQAGVAMVNDVTGGTYHPQMLSTVAQLGVPMVVMHTPALPRQMQVNPTYNNVVNDVLYYLAERVQQCRQAGITDVIIDPGFGFGKTLAHNYSLLKHLPMFTGLNCPLLVGISRKSMICKPLEVLPEQALNGTTAVHSLALNNGANILRAHDVKEAIETIRIYTQYRQAE